MNPITRAVVDSLRALLARGYTYATGGDLTLVANALSGDWPHTSGSNVGVIYRMLGF